MHRATVPSWKDGICRGSLSYIPLCPSVQSHRLGAVVWWVLSNRDTTLLSVQWNQKWVGPLLQRRHVMQGRVMTGCCVLMGGLLSTARFCSRVGWPLLGGISEAMFLIVSVRVFQRSRAKRIHIPTHARIVDIHYEWILYL